MCFTEGRCKFCCVHESCYNIKGVGIVRTREGTLLLLRTRCQNARFFCSETSTTTLPINQRLCEHPTKSNSNHRLLLRVESHSVKPNPETGTIAEHRSFNMDIWPWTNSPGPRFLKIGAEFFVCEDTDNFKKFYSPEQIWRINWNVTLYKCKLEMSKNWSTIAELLASRLTNPEIVPFPVWTSRTKTWSRTEMTCNLTNFGWDQFERFFRSRVVSSRVCL